MAQRTRTTMAKLDRERKVLERRIEKKARKDLRKREAALAAERPAPQGIAEPPAE
jgi:hypothetical protein